MASVPRTWPTIHQVAMLFPRKRKADFGAWLGYSESSSEQPISSLKKGPICFFASCAHKETWRRLLAYAVIALWWSPISRAQCCTGAEERAQSSKGTTQAVTRGFGACRFTCVCFGGNQEVWSFTAKQLRPIERSRSWPPKGASDSSRLKSAPWSLQICAWQACKHDSQSPHIGILTFDRAGESNSTPEFKYYKKNHEVQRYKW